MSKPQMHLTKSEADKLDAAKGITPDPRGVSSMPKAAPFNDRCWVPVYAERSGTGPTYCSPSCGRGCTWKEHQDACTRAVALCTILGHGWAPRVWENLGWHYMAVKGGAEIHACHHAREVNAVEYACYLQGTPQIVSQSHWAPEDALAAAKSEAHRLATSLFERLQEIER